MFLDRFLDDANLFETGEVFEESHERFAEMRQGCLALCSRPICLGIADLRSEVELHTQLDVSRRVALWTGDKAKGRAGHVRVGARENMPVEGIECREPKLEVPLLRNMEVLQNRDILIDRLGAAELRDPQRGVPIRHVGREDEGRLIELGDTRGYCIAGIPGWF